MNIGNLRDSAALQILQNAALSPSLNRTLKHEKLPNEDQPKRAVTPSVQPASRNSLSAIASLSAQLISIKSSGASNAASGRIGLSLGGLLDQSAMSHANNAKLAAKFKTEYQKARSAAGISDANAAHIALYETIMANRSSFPASGFRIFTDLGNGASIDTPIPPAGHSVEVTVLSIEVTAAVTSVYSRS